MAIFFRLSAGGLPLLPRYGKGSSGGRSHAAAAEPSGEGSRGLVHAVLPTKMKLPFGFHAQANWLLSVDRQGLQVLHSSSRLSARCGMGAIPFF